MAQDFERAVAKDSSSDINIGTTARAVFDCDSNDAIVGIRMANVITSQITVDCFVRTAAAGALAVKLFSSNKTESIGIIGSGVQARLQLEYIQKDALVLW